MKLGADLREARLYRGLTLREVSQRVGCTAAFLCDVEHGRRPLGGPKGQAILRFFKGDL